MAPGLTAVVAALAATVVLWLVWRARAEAARREALRRALEVITDDGAGLLSAVMSSLEAHRRASGSTATELETARETGRALVRLVDAARAYARAPHQQLDRAEGLVRVGIALARSRGRRVRLRGASTELRTRANVETTARAVVTLVEAMLPSAPTADPMAKQEFVEITLEPEELRLVGKASEVGPDVLELVEACGWKLRSEGAGTWSLGTPGDELPVADARAHGAARLPAR